MSLILVINDLLLDGVFGFTTSMKAKSTKKEKVNAIISTKTTKP